MVSAVDLLPCAHCGGEAWLNDYEAKHGDMTPASRCPQCKSCGCNLGYLPTEAKAIAAWNRRAPVSAGKVKALMWVADPYNEGDYQFWRARAGDYLYEVGCNLTYWWQEDGAANLCATEGFADADAAKAAAQADYEARILSALQPGDGWQGIESAPKDGTEFLGIKWSWRYPRNCYWYSQRGSFENPFYAAFADQPTHWMPFSALGRPPASLPQGEETR